jgi:hypothetical protein
MTLVQARDFQDKTLQTQATKQKINKWDYSNLKFCTAKEIVNRGKRQPTEWKKISSSCAFDKRLISRPTRCSIVVAPPKKLSD